MKNIIASQFEFIKIISHFISIISIIYFKNLFKITQSEDDNYIKQCKIYENCELRFKLITDIRFMSVNINQNLKTFSSNLFQNTIAKHFYKRPAYKKLILILIFIDFLLLIGYKKEKKIKLIILLIYESGIIVLPILIYTANCIRYFNNVYLIEANRRNSLIYYAVYDTNHKQRGYLSMFKRQDAIDIINIILDDTINEFKIRKFEVRTVFSYMKAQGADRIVCRLDKNESNLIGLVQKLGFELVKNVEKNYFFFILNKELHFLVKI